MQRCKRNNSLLFECGAGELYIYSCALIGAGDAEGAVQVFRELFGVEIRGAVIRKT